MRIDNNLECAASRIIPSQYIGVRSVIEQINEWAQGAVALNTWFDTTETTGLKVPFKSLSQVTRHSQLHS